MEKRFFVFDGPDREPYVTNDLVMLNLFESLTGQRHRIVFSLSNSEQTPHGAIYHGVTVMDEQLYEAVITLHTKDRHADSVVLTPVPSTPR